jgi:hypothetical protein
VIAPLYAAGMTIPRISDSTRRWIYNIGVTVLPLLVLYGVVEVADLPLWTALLSAVLIGAPSGVARANWTRTDNAQVVNGVVSYDTAADPVAPVIKVVPEEPTDAA